MVCMMTWIGAFSTRTDNPLVPNVVWPSSPRTTPAKDKKTICGPPLATMDLLDPKEYRTACTTLNLETENT
jgi:hypothetical protein